MSKIEEFWAQHQGEDPLTMVKAVFAIPWKEAPFVNLHPILSFKDVTVTIDRESWRRDPESVADIPCDIDTIFDFVTVPSPINTVCKKHGDMYGDWDDFAVDYPETQNHGDIETYLAWYDPAGFKENEPLPEKGQEEMADKMFAPADSIYEVPEDYIDNDYDSVDEDAGDPPMTDEEVLEDWNNELYTRRQDTDFGSTYTWIAGGDLIIAWFEDIDDFKKIHIDLTRGTAKLERY